MYEVCIFLRLLLFSLIYSTDLSINENLFLGLLCSWQLINYYGNAKSNKTEFLVLIQGARCTYKQIISVFVGKDHNDNI